MTQLTKLETDTIGEIMNISLGNAATSLSIMFNTKVDITVPSVTTTAIKLISYPDGEPAVYTQIRYTQGFSGSNIMVLKQSDISNILFKLTGMEGMGSEMDEFSLSATSELMNQMMGASATAMASLFNMAVDISTPETAVFTNYQDLLNMDESDEIILVKFVIEVEGIMSGEFINVLQIDFAKKLVELSQNANLM